MEEREFELVNIIGAELGANQRDLSKLMELSLGQTNMLIKRLVSKGYIRISQLNKKKVQYLLTPKGFAEKMRKSVNYTLKTINSIGLINKTLNDILVVFSAKEIEMFYIVGKSDFAAIVETAVKRIHSENCQITHIDNLPNDKRKGVFLICREGINAANNVNKESCINIIEELAKDEELVKEIT